MKTKTVFYCTECGNETPKWAGRCPACGAWNSIVEQTDKPVKSGRKPASARAVKPVPIMDIGTADEIRFSTGMGELDRVLGGGAVNAGNEKNARAIDSTIYLMKNVRCPAILIECGFLSNPAETRLLLTDEYQVKLAACIAAGLLQYHTEGAKA